VAPAILFISSLWGILIVAGFIGIIAVAVYAMRTLSKDEGWEERPPPPPKDEQL
jgi:hypothetical protein